MPTKINGQLIVWENIEKWRVVLAQLFGGWIRVHRWTPQVNVRKAFEIKASVISLLEHVSGYELQAMQDQQDKARKEAEAISAQRAADKAKRDADAKKPTPTIPGRDHK